MSESQEILRTLLQKRRETGQLTPAEFEALIRAQDANPQTGPDIGEPVPDFTLPDAHGRQWGRAELTGPHGLVLVFHRSADW
ncbi:MAG: hypothetical protein AB1671_08460 [Thermodesulfobacteriota bacterium]